MTESVAQILTRIESGDKLAVNELMPLVYEELRKMAAAKLADEKTGHSLQTTALVHEAYLRLVGSNPAAEFANRRHFFAAASEAMRRILVERARRKQSIRHGGQWNRIEPLVDPPFEETDPGSILAVHELLDRFADGHPRQAQIAKMKFFLNCSFNEIAEILGISPDTAQDDWTYAKAWLRRECSRADGHE